MTEQILSLACGITNPSEEEMPLLETLCHAAETMWSKRIRGDATVEECAEAFLCAAAFTAAADFVVSRNSENVESFTAGEISVKRSGSAEGGAQAEALRTAAERLMTPYAVAETFAFKGVRG